MLPHQRLDYWAVSHRAPLSLPSGGRLSVRVIVNSEEWDPGRTMPARC
jgi:hypothetical protein